MECKYIFCIDNPVSHPVPKIVTANAHLFENVRKVLDIGAGRGRFVKFFKQFNVNKYVAVEPCTQFARELLKLLPPDNVIVKPWQEVRDILLQESWDVIVAWNVAMFLDLRNVHKTTSFLRALVHEIAEWIVRSKILLLSFFPVKSGLPEISGCDVDNPRAHFDSIVSSALKLANKKSANAKLYEAKNMQYIIVNCS